MKYLRAMKALGATIAIGTIFLVPHFLAGIYAGPKPPAAECSKPDGPSGSRT